SRRDKRAAKRLLRKLLKRQTRVPRVMITDKLASYGAAKAEVMPSVEHRRHKGFVWGDRCQGSSSAAAFLRLVWGDRCQGSSSAAAFLRLVWGDRCQGSSSAAAF